MDYWIWTVICLLLTHFIIKAYRKTHYFLDLGIPQPKEWPFIGIMYCLFFPRRHVNDLMTFIYNTNKEAKYIGAHMFLSPAIFIRDLELVKTVLVKNFDHFADRKAFVDEKADPLFGQNLNFLNGDRWREVRNMLSPAFTSSKMKAMFTLMSKCAENFTDHLLKRYADADAMDAKDVFSRYTNDVIASCAFGIEVDSLKNPTNDFYILAGQATSFKGVTNLKLMLEMAFPWLTRKMGMRIVSKKVTDFFVNVISETMKYRDEHGIVRPDMLQLMMESRDKMKEEGHVAKFDLLEMTAQAFIFFLAGFEASSSNLCLMCHEMAVNPDIQAKVRVEVDAVMKATDGKPTYEAINNNMPYLEAVFSETMRKHGIAFLNRLCSKEFELPPALPGSKPYKLTPGQGIMVPAAAIHMDPDIYPDPEKFDPERFIDKKVAIGDISNLGFGLGPRMCIGNRFAILEIKTLLVHLLSKCELLVCEKTCVPMKYEESVFVPQAKGGFWLKLKSRN